jgi:hypothetical protein
MCNDDVRVLNTIDFFSKLLLSKHKALIGILCGKKCLQKKVQFLNLYN